MILKANLFVCKPKKKDEKIYIDYDILVSFINSDSGSSHKWLYYKWLYPILRVEFLAR